MKITGKTTELSHFFYNLWLFSPGKGEAKKTISQGFIKLSPLRYGMFGMASDDMVAIQSEVAWSPPYVGVDYLGPGWDWFEITADESKRLSNVAASSEGPETTLDINCHDFDDTSRQKYWSHMEMLIEIEGDGRDNAPFTLSPDRLRRFGLLEPRGRHPIDMRHASFQSVDFLQWKMGTNLGVITTLNRANLSPDDLLESARW